MAGNNPVALTIASKSKNSRAIVKRALQNDTLKLRESNDVIGVQICGSIKNVIALAAGMLDGMGYPESTQCFLITESIHDIKALIGALGGKPSTILSYAGVGDLLLTCTSIKSRNYSSKGYDYAIELTYKNIQELNNELSNNERISKYSIIEYDADDIV